ncbi:unnamed protein product, partial [Ectocarpus sp. 12 AP-2014]
IHTWLEYLAVSGAPSSAPPVFLRSSVLQACPLSRHDAVPRPVDSASDTYPRPTSTLPFPIPRPLPPLVSLGAWRPLRTILLTIPSRYRTARNRPSDPPDPVRPLTQSCLGQTHPFRAFAHP